MTALLNFDIYAMVKPKTPEDVVALLDECLNEISHLNELLDNLFANCAKNAGKSPPP